MRVFTRGCITIVGIGWFAKDFVQWAAGYEYAQEEKERIPERVGLEGGFH